MSFLERKVWRHGSYVVSWLPIQAGGYRLRFAALASTLPPAQNS